MSPSTGVISRILCTAANVESGNQTESFKEIAAPEGL
jgi:hypothetical protein